MTEAEIMKALAYCKNQGLTSECTECPYKGTKRDCMGVMLEAALALINRKNAEIERLNEHLSIWKDIAHRETSYVEIARDGAIKNFIGGVKFHTRDDRALYGKNAIHRMLDQIAKEMGVEL